MQRAAHPAPSRRSHRTSAPAVVLLLLRLAVLLAAALTLAALAGCDRDGIPPLVEVTEVSPREIEVGDRVELRGAGFPQGRTARVTFRGTLLRPGMAPSSGATIEAEGVVSSSDHIEVVVSEPLDERFCGHGDHAAHTTMNGEVEVAFPSSTPGAPPLVGVMHGVTLDITPSSVSAGVMAARAAEGARVLAFLGVTPGVATPRGVPVEAIAPGLPGERAGFQVGDLISAVDGVHVREVADVAPASARSALFTLRHGDSGGEETKTLAMVGYAGERIPVEYEPALLLVGIALAALLLLVLPAPTIASALELRVARRLRSLSLRSAATALVGHGPRAIGSALASVLVATFALGPHVIGDDLDGAVLLLTAIALFLASRVASARGAMASLRAARDVALCGLVLAAAMAGVVIHGGALHLAEIVRAQGGAPWEFAALRQPVVGVLALAYVGGLFAVSRARDVGPTSIGARMESPRTEANGRLLERLGLVVASALGVAVFFGGWQLPGGLEAHSTLLQAVAAVLFVVKAWSLVAVLSAAASLASPWTAREERRFLALRVAPALVVGAGLAVLARKLGPSESLEAALGATLVIGLVLVSARAALRIRGAMQRPEPHASPFL